LNGIFFYLKSTIFGLLIAILLFSSTGGSSYKHSVAISSMSYSKLVVAESSDGY